MTADHVDNPHADGRRPPFGENGDGNGRCPDADLLAGMVDGRLLPSEREQVERHVDACEACRRVVAAVVREREGVAPLRAPRKHRRNVLIAVSAAAIVVALGGFITWRVLHEPPTERTVLAAAFRSLQQQQPKLFEGVAPLTDAALDAPSAAVLRGGVTLRHPVGRVLDLRPPVRWNDVAGIHTWEVVMSSDDLRELWRGTTDASPLEFPADQPELESGRTYMVRLEGRGPAGPIDIAGAFEVATAAAREAFQAARAAIGEHVDEDVRQLVLAQFALSQGLLHRAEAAARRHCRAHPDSRLGHRTLRQALRRIGDPEAETIEIPGGE